MFGFQPLDFCRFACGSAPAYGSAEEDIFRIFTARLEAVS
jgi:hypothetical protein